MNSTPEPNVAYPELDCLDCPKNLINEPHYYMIHDYIWHRVVPEGKGMLCFDCLEKRLGRMLTPSDFTVSLLNEEHKRNPRFSLIEMAPLT